MGIEIETIVEIPKKFLCGSFCCGCFYAKQVIGLADDDNEGNTRCEASNDGRRDKGDLTPQVQDADGEHEQT